MKYELLKELRDRFWLMQMKYIYYIIALSVSCIGFSTYQTFNSVLAWRDLPLGMAVFFWLLSILFGFIVVRKGIKRIEMEIQRLSNLDFPDFYEVNTSLATREFTFSSEICFALGILSFLVWRIFEMAY